jgi:hypothetical protein
VVTVEEVLTVFRSLASISGFVLVLTCGAATADEPSKSDAASPIRGILVRPDRVTTELLTAWSGRGASAVVVPLDESVTRARWASLATTVARAGFSLYPWVEVARNPAMADAHPELMAATGGHHNDWRRRFPGAPVAKPGEVVKAWPWVPIGYAPALEAHRQRLTRLLEGLPGKWAGVFVNDLQAGPSSCGCGNDQCRWALDYGTPSTAPKTAGDDAAARVVTELRNKFPGKRVVPVWVTECETIDLDDAKGSTGLCGGVHCARADCWPRYARAWGPLVKATEGPLALAAWPGPFRRDPGWVESAISLFGQPIGGAPIPPARIVAVLQGWGQPEKAQAALIERARRAEGGWVLALDEIDQSWEPRLVKAPK